MAPELRCRTRNIAPESYATDLEYERSSSPAVSEMSIPTESMGLARPPIYTIDLSLPPRQRYAVVVSEYLMQIRVLPSLFDNLIDSVRLPKSLIHFIARMLLRKVFSKEQTEELRGISETADIPMYLLVAYNVLLDLFMGCTSGGAQVHCTDNDESTMMHFRTLDWDMPELRDVVVQFDYVARPGGDVIARTIGYVGFVGVLTGLRKELSVSMNFRPYHDNDMSMLANLKFYYQQFAVLLGLQPSLASIMRDFVLPRNTHIANSLKKEKEAQPHFGYDDITTKLPHLPSTAAYLIFCTPNQTVLLEKDRKEAKVMISSEFWTTTNHDILYEQQQDADDAHAAHAAYAKTAFGGLGMKEVVEESIERKKCLVDKWEAWNRRHGRRYTKRRIRRNSDGTIDKSVPLEELKQWMVEAPISNVQTHFACIMDPKEGVFRWTRTYHEGEIGESEDEQCDNDIGSPCKHGRIAGCCRPL
jgi:hypothetical protein